jgi:hypothetical protein
MRLHLTRARLAGALIAVSSLTSLGLFSQAGAHASTESAWVCTGTNTFTFNPPLTASNTSGTFTVSYTRTCVIASADTDPVGESARQYTDSGSAPSGTYFGSCALALLSNGIEHTLVGGTVLSNSDGTDTNKAAVLVPDHVCNEAVATGPAVTQYLFSS